MGITSGLILTLVAAISALPLDRTEIHNNGGSQGKLHRSARSVACRPPNNISQLFENLNNNIDTTMFLRHVRASNTHFFQNNELNINKAMDSFYYGEKSKCPNVTLNTSPDAELWERSLCPWYFNITVLPPGHYPPIIPQAVCRCDECISATANQCEKISTSIRVLVESGCQDGFYTYRQEIFPHDVGCTCAARRLAPAEPDTPACPPHGCPT